MIEHPATSSIRSPIATDPETTATPVAAVASHTQVDLGYATEHRQWRE